MDKLQWFKFTPTDWIMGKIQKCPEVTQARFMRLICLYWNKDCILSIEDAEIEIDKEHLDILFSKKTIKFIDGFISIDFLNEQFEEILKLSQKRRDSVLQRWNKVKQNDTIVSKSNTIVLQNDTEKERELELDKEEEKRKEKEEENSNSSVLISDQLKIDPNPQKIDLVKFQKFFNDNRGVFPEIKKLSEARKKRIAILEKQYGKECLMIAIEKARDSPFLQGENNKNWVASFDWIFTPANFLKILEDNYAKRQNTAEKSNSQLFANAMQSETAKNFRFK